MSFSQQETRALCPGCFLQVVECFLGGHPDYQPIDARYHDLEHDAGDVVFLHAPAAAGQARSGRCYARKPSSWGSGDSPARHRLFEAAGRPDRNGAKYTATHVNRSCDFARRFLVARGFSPEADPPVQSMIRCTGLGVKVAALTFHSEEERVAGYALGTADLIGQMAASDHYLEKLPIPLFTEFAESAAYNAGRGGSDGSMFKSAEDLIRKTPGFWKTTYFRRSSRTFLGCTGTWSIRSTVATNTWI